MSVYGGDEKPLQPGPFLTSVPSCSYSRQQCVGKFNEYDFLKDLASKYGDDTAELDGGTTSQRQR